MSIYKNRHHEQNFIKEQIGKVTRGLVHFFTVSISTFILFLNIYFVYLFCYIQCLAVAMTKKVQIPLEKPESS